MYFNVNYSKGVPTQFKVVEDAYAINFGRYAGRNLVDILADTLNHKDRAYIIATYAERVQEALEAFVETGVVGKVEYLLRALDTEVANKVKRYEEGWHILLS